MKISLWILGFEVFTLEQDDGLGSIGPGEIERPGATSDFGFGLTDPTGYEEE